MAEGKGMSKGCLIGLIVVGIIVVVVAIIGVSSTCIEKTSLTSEAQVKEMVAENPPEGIEPEQFNEFADAFVEKLKAGEIDPQRTALLIQQVSGYMSDKKIDADELQMIKKDMAEIFPELSGMLESDADMEMDMDTTTGMLEDSLATP